MEDAAMDSVVLFQQSGTWRGADGRRGRVDLVHSRLAEGTEPDVQAMADLLRASFPEGCSLDSTKVLETLVVCPLMTQRCLLDVLSLPAVAAHLAAAFAASAYLHCSRSSQLAASNSTITPDGSSDAVSACLQPTATAAVPPELAALPTDAADAAQDPLPRRSSKPDCLAVDYHPQAATSGLMRQQAVELPDFSRLLQFGDAAEGMVKPDSASARPMTRLSSALAGREWVAEVRVPEGIKAVVLDVDDTLVLHKSDRDLSARWRQMRAAGLAPRRRQEEHDIIAALTPHAPFLRALADALAAQNVPLYIASFATAPYVRRVVSAVFGARRVPRENLKCFRDPFGTHPLVRNKALWLAEVAEAVGAADNPGAVLFVDDCEAHVAVAQAEGFRGFAVDQEVGLGPIQWESIVDSLQVQQRRS